ncbi:molecular chaperone DnaJ [Candidatus Parcubacteria bacterium]|nr:molecular chaperone DnaJ [Candidatus Parcubacteria bacterium]
MSNYYDILGVPKTASSEEIKRAFRKLAHQHHPDKSGGDEQKFKEANEAYQVLSNPKKRKQYDQFGQTFEQAQAGGGFSGFNGFRDFSGFADAFRSGGGGVNFDFDDLGDIVGDLFGMGGRSARARTRTQHGQDIEIQMALDFKEAAFGAEKEIELDKNVICPKCNGNGAEPGTKIETCKTCGGTGQVTRVQRTILGSIQTSGICPDCQGEGKVPSQKCSQCRGAGIVQSKEKIKFKVPAGISAGKSIRLLGRGEAGIRGGAPGDLYITFIIREHSRFKREEDDVITQEEITFSQAALGDKIDVETLDGKVKLKIPTGTQTGKIFKLSDRGIPYLRGRGRGDHLVEIIVKTPQKLSRKEKKLFEELRDED